MPPLAARRSSWHAEWSLPRVQRRLHEIQSERADLRSQRPHERRLYGVGIGRYRTIPRRKVPREEIAGMGAGCCRATTSSPTSTYE
ncbi:hypothetical protein AcV7_007644 [Taiwanofungus camphoratus]|nr:hypothetical protein AcV7_007644 [Antrodia cinnamomea]